MMMEGGKKSKSHHRNKCKNASSPSPKWNRVESFSFSFVLIQFKLIFNSTMKSNEVTASIDALPLLLFLPISVHRSEVVKKSYNFSSCWFSFHRSMWLKRDLGFLSVFSPFIPSNVDLKCLRLFFHFFSSL